MNKTVLITAGPTNEHIDPVRFIGNHSSGKMGYAIAERFAERGAKVSLVSGPVKIKAKHPNITVTNVTSAKDMLEATQNNFAACEIGIFCAAVADYTPTNVASQKVKRNSPTYTIELKATTDIAATMGQQKTKNQFLVGFALETQNEELNAIGKLKKKNMDMVILNSLNDKGAGFNTDTNKVSFIHKTEQIEVLPLMSKDNVAEAIVNAVLNKV